MNQDPNRDVHGVHGTPSEVSWDQGRGRQPYANQGQVEQGPPGPGEVAGGDRGERSGRNQQQDEAVRGTPGGPALP